MKRPFAIVFTSLLILCANVSLVSAATPPGPQSDSNLRATRARVERDIDMLARDPHDYGGHRVKAIEDLQDARAQLNLGLGYDAGHDQRGSSSMNPATATLSNATCEGDANLKYVRRDIEQSIDALQRDNADYGGHRVDAIARLQQSRAQIVDAIVWGGTH